MFEGCADPFVLNPFDVGGCQFAGKERILREILEIAAAQRGTLDVRARTQNNGNILFLAFDPDGLPDPADQAAVPGACESGRARETGRGDGIHDAEIVGGAGLLAESVRAVRHHHGGDAEPIDGLGRPEVLS